MNGTLKNMCVLVCVMAIGLLIGDLLKEFDLVPQDSRAEIAAKEIQARKDKMYQVCMEEGAWGQGDDMDKWCRDHAEKNYR